jgi:hypothetical protein
VWFAQGISPSQGIPSLQTAWLAAMIANTKSQRRQRHTSATGRWIWLCRKAGVRQTVRCPQRHLSLPLLQLFILNELERRRTPALIDISITSTNACHHHFTPDGIHASVCAAHS